MIESRRRSPAAAGELPRAVLQPGREVALDTGYSAAESLQLPTPESTFRILATRTEPEGPRARVKRKEDGKPAVASWPREGGAARSLLRQDARKCCGVCSIP